MRSPARRNGRGPETQTDDLFKEAELAQRTAPLIAFTLTISFARRWQGWDNKIKGLIEYVSTHTINRR